MKLQITPGMMGDIQRVKSTETDSEAFDIIPPVWGSLSLSFLYGLTEFMDIQVKLDLPAHFGGGVGFSLLKSRHVYLSFALEANVMPAPVFIFDVPAYLLLGLSFSSAVSLEVASGYQFQLVKDFSGAGSSSETQLFHTIPVALSLEIAINSQWALRPQIGLNVYPSLAPIPRSPLIWYFTFGIAHRLSKQHTSDMLHLP